MKNVLIIIGKLIVGGAERVGRDIGFYADKKKYCIHYLVFEDDVCAYERELMDAGCIIHHMNPPSEGYRRYYKRLCELIAKEHIDIIHSHTMFNSGWAMLAGRQKSVLVRIAHSHSIKGPEHRGPMKNIYEKTMRLIIRHYATDFVACGKGAGNWLYGKHFFEEKGTLIYNGIGLEEFIYREDAREKIRIERKLQDKYVIGHVGHLVTVKNQIFLLGLMPDIIKRRPETILLLLGDGEDRSMIEQEIKRMGLSEHVILTGNVNNVGEYMSAMDVYVFPSLYEGMPLALVEAQTNGLPCVISNRIPDDVYLTDLVDPLPLEDSDEQWISHIIKAKRKTPEAYGKKMFEMGFDTQGMLKKIYKLYEGVR